MNDRYYVDYSYGGYLESPSGGTSGEATGGIFTGAGGSDGLGGDTSNGGLMEAGAAPGDGGATDAAGGAMNLGGAPSMGGSFARGGTLGLGGIADNGGSVFASGGAPSGGTVGTGGTAMGGRASGGVPGMGGALASGGSQFQPVCGDEVVKSGACDSTSTQFCYKTCGPNSIGFKSESCLGGTYVEQNGCTFPAGADYSCYKLPRVLPMQCPAGVPRATQACQVPECVVCFGGGVNNPLYQDSTGSQKSGYCVCTDAGVWTCASTTSWPCSNTGCTGI